MFFRAGSIGNAWHLLTHAWSPVGVSGVSAPGIVDARILWALIIGLTAAEWIYRNFARVGHGLESGRLPAIAGRYALVAAMVVSAGATQVGEARPFIYFQF